MERTAMIALLVTATTSPHLCAQQFAVRVRNDMTDTSQLWWTAQHNGRDLGWTYVEVNRNRTIPVYFLGDDPFYLVTRVQGADLHAGKHNLRALIAGDPDAVLELGGEFVDQVQTLMVWNPCAGQFEARPSIFRRRVAVNIDVHANGRVIRIKAVPR